MLHRLAGHIGGAKGVQHVQSLDTDLELKEVAEDQAEPTCGACVFAKMKRAPTSSGPHTPWGKAPGDGVALDCVEKTASRRGNTCALLLTDMISGHIMPTFHTSKSSQSAVAGLKEWTAATYKAAAPPGVWILLDRDSTFLGDSLQPTKNTVFYNNVTQVLGWRPHFCAGDEHATHGIAESTVQKVANTTRLPCCTTAGWGLGSGSNVLGSRRFCLSALAAPTATPGARGTLPCSTSNVQLRS
jgi:hypothetical protein